MADSAFTHEFLPGRVLFGSGALARLSLELARIEATHPAVICTAGSVRRVDELIAKHLGQIDATWITCAVMHTPVEVTDLALAELTASGADCLIAVGGGSAIGLAKALALRTGLPLIAVPTTYAGSEMTPIIGQTQQGVKTSQRDMRVLPRTVIYDPATTIDLPFAISLPSAVNGMAHAVEALYSQDRSPLLVDLAARGIRAFMAALPLLHRDSANIEARELAQLGALACGKCLGEAGMSLHHKLCHTLGGSFDLPHAETHTVLLPHIIAFNAPAGSAALHDLQRAFDASDPAMALWEMVRAFGGPISLSAIGFDVDQTGHAADLAMANPYWNPRTFDWADIRHIIHRAALGMPPLDKGESK